MSGNVQCGYLGLPLSDFWAICWLVMLWRKLFGDVTEFGATGYDFISKQHVEVESVRSIWMGFPCKDVSSLCPRRVEHRANIAAGELSLSTKTGNVFENGVLKYVTQHGEQLRVLILENVLGLAQSPGEVSPLDVCISKLRELNWYSVVFVLRPDNFGFPQTRHSHLDSPWQDVMSAVSRGL